MNKAQKWITEHILGMKASTPPTGAMLPANGPGKFIEVNGTVTWISDKLASYITEGYQANDIVYAGLMLVMDKVRVAPWDIYKVVDESSLKKYRAIISNKMNAKDYAQALSLRKKALGPITSFNPRLSKLKDLLEWPNEFETWGDLVAEGAGWKMLTGNEMLWGNILPGGANQGIPQELIHAPSQYTRIIATRGFPQRIVGWYMDTEAKRFSKEEILHQKFWNPQYDTNGSHLYGMSPLKSASKTLTRNNSIKVAGAVQFQNNGAPGIAYVDDELLKGTEREVQAKAIKRTLAAEHAGADQYNKIAVSGYKMGYVSVGMSLKDMDASTMENIDLRRLFNIWGIPSQLGNDPDNKTFNNQKEAEKALTTRCALPHLTSKRDHLNRKLQTDWGFKGQNVYVDFDMSVYSELQEDQKEKWEWVSKLPVSSAYKLELMNLDIPEDPNLDIILVDGNMVPLSDVVNRMSDDEANVINEELNKSGLNDYR